LDLKHEDQHLVKICFFKQARGENTVSVMVVEGIDELDNDAQHNNSFSGPETNLELSAPRILRVYYSMLRGNIIATCFYTLGLLLANSYIDFDLAAGWEFKIKQLASQMG
jgi:hypothetical protein